MSRIAGRHQRRQPGPRVRSFCQDPRLLEHVLLDFPQLRVIACHLGHPDERLLVTYLRRFSNLALDLDDDTRAAYLGGTAHALLSRD